MKIISLFLAACFTFSVSFAQSADDIINKHINAIGGKENLKKVKSYVRKGAISIEGADIQVVISVQQDVGYRLDMTLMEQSIYEIVTPSEGWMYNPFQGATTAEAMTEEKLLESQSKLDAQYELLDYKAKGHTAILLGKEDVDGVDCFKLEFIKMGESPEVIFIHPSTYYIVQKIKTAVINGEENEVVTKFSDFKKHSSGIVYPMLYEGTPFGPETQMVIESIEINTKIDPEIFKPSN